jgi:tripartite-type tricarboxylate transporter receptor subunit TctC
MFGHLPWDGLRDFQGVGVPARVQNVAVVPANLPVKTLREFVAYASARPGQLNFGNAGNGSSPYLSSELLFQVTGIKLASTNYKGQPPLIPDLLSGQVHFTVALGLALPHIKSGKLRPLAVFTQERVAALPEVPTVTEAGYPEAGLVPWYGSTYPQPRRKISSSVSMVLSTRQSVRTTFNPGSSRPALSRGW